MLALPVLTSTPVWASTLPGADSTAVTATDLRAALLYGTPGDDAWREGAPAVQARAGSRSIPLAFAMSAAVPGLGQAYNGHWVKAALVVALEAAVIYGYLDARQQGLDEEAAYEAYAHQFWSPAQYAAWLEDYSAWLPNVERMAIDPALVAGIDLSDPDGWSDADRQRVRAFFNEIRAVESAVYHPETGASFSHKLPYYGEQQYYELIGKYFQFAPGWEDYPAWKEGETFTDAIDPEKSGPGGEKVNVQGRFWEYDDMAEHANNLLRRASRLSALIIVNHLVSAIDAAVFAKLHNDRLDADLALAYDAFGNVRPRAAMRLRF